MDEEQRFFYENQLNFFEEENQILSFQKNHELIPLMRAESIIERPQLTSVNAPVSEFPLFRAYNPLDRLKDIPQDKQNQYFFMFSNHKRFNGIQHFFEFGSQDKYTGDFLQNIQSDALGNNGNPDFELDKLFHGDVKHTYKQQIQNTLFALNKKLEQINHKSLGNINLNRTISNSFYEHFQNFSLVFNSANFLQEMEVNLKNLLTNSKKMKGPGMDLISTIYDFWMKSFKDFVNEIWKHSSKFTLNFFKNNQTNQEEQPQKCDESQQNQQGCESSHNELKSESSNTIGSKQKRKGWTNQQTLILEQLINSNIIFSHSVLKKIASQFNRSVTSISSKIQKLTKTKKGEQTQEEPLLKRAIEIVKMYPEGLNRETIIQKINENYEMGYGGQWEKSVGQLLSNRKQFIKIRGKHKLINPTQYKLLNNDQGDHSKLTFKDKVIQSFLNCPNAQAELKILVDVYISLFGEAQKDNETIIEQKRKSIESNISKTLSRYQIFDNSRAKTIYLLNPLMNQVQARNMDIEVDNYFDL